MNNDSQLVDKNIYIHTTDVPWWQWTFWINLSFAAKWNVVDSDGLRAARSSAAGSQLHLCGFNTSSARGLHSYKRRKHKTREEKWKRCIFEQF